MVWDAVNFGRKLRTVTLPYRITVRAFSFSELAPWSRVVKPLDSLPAFYGTRRFITAFTRDLHMFLCRGRPFHPTSPRSILILVLSTHLRLGLHSSLFPCGFPTNILYEFLFFPIRATFPAHLILLDLIILIILGEGYKS
jgi:hypothetical protein